MPGSFPTTLTKRDTLSWKNKSGVVGITIDNQSKAYDWNALVKQKIIYDIVNTKMISKSTDSTK